MNKQLRSEGCLLAVAVVALGTSLSAWGDPIQWNGNGHYYELLPEQSGLSWSVARTQAESQSHLGAGGYLATITSQSEYDFLRSHFLGSGTLAFVFLGGERAGSPETWQWVTGEAWSFTKWKPGEPTGEPLEDALQMYGNADPNGTKYPGFWNDMPKDAVYSLPSAALVEYTVPMPAAAWMGGVGLLCVAVVKRLRRR